jgi:hypothetical protein
LQYVIKAVAFEGTLPALLPTYTFRLLSPTLKRPKVAVFTLIVSTFEILKDVEKLEPVHV